MVLVLAGAVSPHLHRVFFLTNYQSVLNGFYLPDGYSKIEFADDGAPFQFKLTMTFDAASDPYKTDFQICLDADLNLMMKMLLGSKIQGALDKVVDSLVDLSEGRMPEGVDLSNLK